MIKRLLFILVFIGFCASSANANAGEIRVYDANGQYLGIFTGSPTTVGHSFAQSIFLPDLNLFFRVYERYDYDPEGLLGEITLGSYFLDDSGDRFFTALQVITRSCDGTYMLGYGDPIVISATGVLNECENTAFTTPRSETVFHLQPFDVTRLPFTLPVALPLRYEYHSDATRAAIAPAMDQQGAAIMICMLLAVGAWFLKRRGMIKG